MSTTKITTTKVITTEVKTIEKPKKNGKSKVVTTEVKTIEKPKKNEKTKTADKSKKTPKPKAKQVDAPQNISVQVINQIGNSQLTKNMASWKKVPDNDCGQFR